MDLSAEYYRLTEGWGSKDIHLSDKGKEYRSVDYLENCVKIAQEYATKGKALVKALKEEKKCNG